MSLTLTELLPNPAPDISRVLSLPGGQSIQLPAGYSWSGIIAQVGIYIELPADVNITMYKNVPVDPIPISAGIVIEITEGSIQSIAVDQTMSIFLVGHATREHVPLKMKVVNATGLPAGSNTIGNVNVNMYAGIYSGDFTTSAVPNTITAMSALNYNVKEITLLADTANTAAILIGGNTPSFPLVAGASVRIRNVNWNQITFKSSAASQLLHVISGGN